MANADYIRRKVHELKEQATRLGSDAIDGLRGSRIGGAVAPTFEELRERARRGSGSSTQPGGGGQIPVVGRQGSGISVGSISPPGSRPSSMTGGMYPPPPGTGAYPHSAAAPHGYPAAAPPVLAAAIPPQAFPAGVPPPPSRGEPAWRGPAHGVYPDIGAPTASTAADVHAAAREPPHRQGAYPAATVPAEAVNGQRTQAPAGRHFDEGSVPVGTYSKFAHEPVSSAPLYVPAPNRVSAASSVPREDLWYTSEPLSAGRAPLEGPIRYPTVGELTPNAGNSADEQLDEPPAVDLAESTEATEEHAVPEVSGREQAVRSADSYPNVGTSGSGSAPRERLREPVPSAQTGGGGASSGYPNVGSTGLGTAPRERVYVRGSRAGSVDGGYANVGTTGLGTAPAERVRPPPGIRQPSASMHGRRASTGSVEAPPQPAAQPAGQRAGTQAHQPQAPQQQSQQQPQQQRPHLQPQPQQASRPQPVPPPPPQAQQQRHQQSQQQQQQQSPAWEQTRWPPAAGPAPTQPPPQVPQPPPPPPISTAAVAARSGAWQLQLQLPFSSSVAPIAQVDVHPTEPWLLLTRCNGSLHVYDHGSSTWPRALPKLTDRGHAVLTACFVTSKRLIVTGCADGNVRVYANDTLQIVKAFDAHKTGVRCLAVHPSKPLLLSASDDGLMKLWKWDKGWDMQGWKDKQTFRGHKTAITALAFNPSGDDTFASASADNTVKIWRVGTSKPEIALKHNEGERVTCLDFCVGKPLLLTGTSGGVAKVWDYQSVACVASLEAHGSPLTSVKFHPELPIILTGCEDGSIRVWDAATWKLEAVLGSGLQRIHALAPIQHSFGWSRRVVVCSGIGALMLHITRVEKALASPGPTVTPPHASAEKLSAGRRKEDDDDSRLCVICQDADAVAGFLHGDSLHRCVCQECAALYKAPGAPKTCPLCNQRIEQVVMKIF